MAWGGAAGSESASPRGARLHRERGWRAATALLILGFGCLWLGLAWARYTTVHHRTYDLALYARMAWGLAHGEPWVTVVGAHAATLHCAWVLWPLGWLGRALGTVPTLLVAQCVAGAAAAWPFARMAARRLGPPGYLLGALSWLAYPTLGHVLTYEFHPGTLGLLGLAWALDAVDRGAPRQLAIGAAAAVLCRADFALITALLGGLVAWRGAAAARCGRWLALGSLVYAACYLVLVPRLVGAQSASLDAHFGHLGGSPGAILGTLLTRPDKVVRHVLEPERLAIQLKLLAPLAFLSLASPSWLVPALAPWTMNLLSQFPTTTKLYSHYHSPLVPFLVGAAIAGAPRVAGWLAARRARAPRAGPDPLVSAGWLGALLAGQLLAGGQPWSRDFPADAFRADAFTSVATKILERIPAGASVQAPDPLLPHLAERRWVDRAPEPERGHRFVVLDLRHRLRYARREVLLRTLEEPVARRWLARPDHGVVAVGPGLALLERGANPREGVARRYFQSLARGRGVRLTRCLSVSGASISGDTLRLDLAAHGACPADLALRLGASARPRRVDLPFGGWLSPAHLRAGDGLRSLHPLTTQERNALRERGLWVGTLRSSGAPPRPADPPAVRVPLSQTSQPSTSPRYRSGRRSRKKPQAAR